MRIHYHLSRNIEKTQFMRLTIVESIQRRGANRAFLAWDASQALGPFARRYKSAVSAYADCVRRVRAHGTGAVRFLDSSGDVGTYREVRIANGRLVEVIGVRNWGEVARRRFTDSARPIPSPQGRGRGGLRTSVR